MIKYIFSLLFLFFLITSLFSQELDSNKSIRDLTSELLIKNKNILSLTLRNDSLKNAITLLNNEIILYKTGLKYPHIGLPNPIKQLVTPKLPTFDGPSLSSSQIKDNGQNIRLQETITKSKKDISNLNKKIRDAQNKIGEQKSEIETLNKAISKLKLNISEQQNINEDLANELQKLESVLSCIKNFELEISRPATKVTLELIEIRKEFEEYKRLIRVKSPDIAKRDAIISNVIKVYENYKGVEKEMNCAGIRLSVYQDYLSVQDYNNIAEIYGRNLGNSITRLDSTNQINESNRRVLDAAGVIMEKGNYDARSEIANNLPKYINKERRPGSANSELKSNFQKIISAYQNESYLEAITLYDSYEKFITLEYMQQQKGLLDEVQYCIGNILLWDLGSYGNYINGIIQGDWVKEYKSIKQCGHAKLNVLMLDKTANLTLRKKAAITINKYYE